MRVHLHPEAVLEIAEASDYYGAISPRLREQFGRELEICLDHLIRHPGAGSSIQQQSGLRRLVLAHFSFSIFYSVVADEIVVLAVAHNARRPGYWQGRHRTQQRVPIYASANS